MKVFLVLGAFLLLDIADGCDDDIQSRVNRRMNDLQLELVADSQSVDTTVFTHVE